MTTTDLARFRDLLRTRQAELLHNTRCLESIAIERSPDVLEEVQYKSERELAIAGLNLESAVQRNIAAALLRIDAGAFGTCIHCGAEISRRRLEVLPWTPLCIRCQEAADLGEAPVLESVEPTFLDAA